MPTVPPTAADPIAELRAALASAISSLGDGGAPGGDARLERQPKPDLGDYSTNAAMVLAPAVGRPPRALAESLRERLGEELATAAERIEVAGPGFLNLFLSDRWYRQAVAGLLAAGEAYGSAEPGLGERVIVEFVSANPTGPLTAAGGRHAAYGDSLSRILSRSGQIVSREYYVNDTGGQVRLFAESIAARMRGEEPPEDGYAGDYVAELATKLEGEGIGPDQTEALERAGTEAMLARIRETLERIRVEFDTWSSERSIYESGELDAVVKRLRESGHVYESEGATWLRTSELGDDKDRVLIRAGGEPTYFAPDIAYHAQKLARAERLINVLGADHHGYVNRMRAAIQALGDDPDRFEVLIMQLVHVVERGERAQMSKRRGEFVTLDDLVDDIGVDAARWFMVQRSHDSTIDLDLELARTRSNENPVYYVQYAHARIASILRKAVDEGAAGVKGESAAEVAPEVAARAASPELRGTPTEPAERELIKHLLELPEETSGAASLHAPHRLCAYATSTAAAFHAFYRDCKVVGAEGEGVEAARLAVCLATQAVLAQTLEMLGVDAPERM